MDIQIIRRTKTKKKRKENDMVIQINTFKIDSAQ